MWKTGDRLIYKTAGICVIERITSESFSGEACEYYHLRPINDDKNTILIPTSSSALVSKMYPLMSNDEAERTISVFKTLEHPWQENDKLRAEEFKKTLDSRNILLIAGLINMVRLKRDELEKRGKKPRSSDIGFCEKAEKLLFSELAFVLETDIEDIRKRIYES